VVSVPGYYLVLPRAALNSAADEKTFTQIPPEGQKNAER
jgi:hypothetical protein